MSREIRAAKPISGRSNVLNPSAPTSSVLAEAGVQFQVFNQSKKDERMRNLAVHGPVTVSAAALIRKLEATVMAEAPRGYFPTPASVIGLMVKKAGLHADMVVLEPSAGSGAIANFVRPLVKDLWVCESHPVLQQILALQGHLIVGADFLEYRGSSPDVILANPPFGDANDPEDLIHLYHGYDILKSGGRLCYVICERAFLRTDEASRHFRRWLLDVGAQVESLPPGAFLVSDRPTQVNARLVLIDKP